MFNSKEDRKTLFVDFFKKNENLDEIALEHKRRHVKSKLAQCVYRPKTEKELMDRHGDQAQRTVKGVVLKRVVPKRGVWEIN